MPSGSVACWSVLGLTILLYAVYLREYGIVCSYSYPHPCDSVGDSGPISDGVCRGEPGSEAFRMVLLADPQITARHGVVGAINNAFNDYYYSAVVSTAAWYLRPSVVVVLGDLFSYQSLPDAEFAARLKRYRAIFSPFMTGKGPYLFLNVSGNHDIGYGSEIDAAKCERFQGAFGKLNGVYTVGEHVIGVVNSNNLDHSRDRRLHGESWQTLESLTHIESPTILLTHIPLHKPYGSCADSPEVVLDSEGYVHTQNTLSLRTSSYILNRVKPSIIFTGHDHEGCHYVHMHRDGNIEAEIEAETEAETAAPTLRPIHVPIHEHTIRSVMAEYGGYMGVFDALKASGDDKWHYSFNSCTFVTHFVIGGLVTSVVLYMLVSLAILTWWLRLRWMPFRTEIGKTSLPNDQKVD